MVRAIKGGNVVPPLASGEVFDDVGADSFGAKFIEEFATLGITGGCGDGDFCPAAQVRRAQMAVFNQSTFDLGMGL